MTIKKFIGALALVSILSVSVSEAATFSWTKSLKKGARNAEVKTLQQYLNSCPDTQISASGVGSSGKETTYFGAGTKKAVVAWQKKNGVSATGTFGPLSQAKAAMLLASTTPCGTSSTSTTTTTTTTTPAQTGPVTAALASTTPAGGSYIVNNQAQAGLLDVVFSGNGAVTSVTLHRSGISGQNTLSNIYLYDGATRLTDGYSFNTAGDLTINNLNIMVSGSKTISVKADAGANASSDSTIAVALSGFTAGTTATMANVQGNLMYLASSGSMASAYLATQASVAVPNATVNAGTSGYTVWSAPVQVNTRSIQLKGANFRMTGSAPVDALSNIKLFVDGIQSGSAATFATINGSNYAMFDFSGSPVVLTTGSHTVDVRADVVKGSSYTVTVSLQQAADLVLFDSQLGLNIAPAVSNSVAFTSNTAGTITINPGSASVVVDPTFSAITNLTGGSTNIAIGKFKVHGYGEDVKVSTLTVAPAFTSPVNATATTSGTTPAVVVGAAGAGYMKTPIVTLTGGTCSVTGTVTPTVTNGTISAYTASGYTCSVAPTGVSVATAASTQNGLNNVTLYFNGSQVGSQQNWTGTALSFNLGSQMIIPAATDSTIEVRADLQDTSSVNYTSGTVIAGLTLGSANGQGQASHATLNFPTANVNPSAISIQTGLLVASANGGYTSQNANPNTVGVKIGSYILQNQSTSESVRVTSFVVGLGTSTTPLTNLSNLRTSEASGSGETPVQPSTTNTFSVDFTLAPGATKTVDILADTSTDTGHNAITTLAVNAVGSSSHIALNVAAVTGQTISLSAGTIGATPTLLASSATTAQYIASANGTVDGSKATYNFVATGGTATITELKFTATGSTTITSVRVGSVSAPVVGGVAYLTGLNLSVPNGASGLNQDVFVSYPVVGTNGLASATTSQLSLTSVKYTSGGVTTTFTPSIVAPTMMLVGSKPTVTVSSSNNAGLTVGENKLMDVTVAADASGNITQNVIVFNVTASGVTSPTLTLARLADGVNTIPGYVCVVTGSAPSFVVTCTNAAGYQITGSKTFSLYGTIGGTLGTAGASSASTQLAAASTFSWTDTTGSAVSAQTTNNSTYLLNYPTQTNSIHN